jgi:phospholipid/cholesterol/gamma-HCH transport system permease protein
MENTHETILEPALAAASLEVREGEGSLVVFLRGRLDAESTGPLWKAAFEALPEKHQKRLVINATEVDYCDGAGIGLIVELRRRQGQETEVRGLAPQFQSLLDLFPFEAGAPPGPKPKPASLPVELGLRTVHILKDLHAQIAFIGELLVDAAGALRRPSKIRWGDVLQVAIAAGVNALPIISMMGLLIGLILAFESALPLKQFGAQVYVANLVAVSVIRELGPLMTAILLAGRSGSAFAAELGTMKVNEEIDALTTMGLGPVRFLVLPRILAAVVITPLLTIYFNLFSLAGAAFVVMSFGYPFVTYATHVREALTITAVLSGLVKSFVFGIIIAGVGCQRGLSTGTGAIAVGVSTTRAVVAGIILTVMVDGVFSVVYYALGI